MKRFVPPIFIRLLLLPLCLGFSALCCVQAQTSLINILQKGELKVGVLNDRHHYHTTADGPQGFDYLYARGYADYLEVALTVVPFYGEQDLLNALTRQTIDIAAPHFSGPSDNPLLSNGPELFTSSLVYLSANATDTPCEALPVEQRLVLPALLNAANAQTKVTWKTATTPDSMSLLEQLSHQQNGCTLLPEVWLPLIGNRFSQFRTESVTDSRLVKQWLTRASDVALLASLFEYTHLSRTNGSLAILRDQLMSPMPPLANQDARAFMLAFEQHYPHIKRQLERLQSNQDILFIAAIDYLQGNWQTNQPDNTFATPLPGERLGQISGAIDLIDARLPARIGAPDRRWFTLAAYAIGIEHIEDARQLTQAAGGNPDLWIDVKQQLPKLSTQYAATPNGFADGQRAVRFVALVRFYAETLALLLKGT
ncbi:hypothetical protein [Alteromonas lipolytica]|uniref:Solute-binding protein family 3/N-terminal domain-containing protein n=1 Tax=Alteromonas lipolytica TaxID=1856405 RepID=A0A1E8FF33_9ALTE|nr:hypothetical protein [Alteromonas lipolytica]OFI34545.1 hypothetical protein BFC17_13165 [Alteromonas lipolytica]GGF51956.1 membrane-bound lytic murein transglycosylase F [Alteromonas lipolytica]